MDGFFSLPQNLVPFSTKLPPSSNENIQIQLALNPIIQNQAYKIRHQGYFSYNYITKREGDLFYDKYDGRQNVRTAVIYKNDIPAATVRLCLFDATGTYPDADTVPAMEIFNSEIREMMDGFSRSNRPKRAVEVTRLARVPEFANDKAIISALFRAVGYLILHFDADIVLNACRPHHMPMYRRFGFQKIEEPRQYPNLTYKAALMACFRSSYGALRDNLTFLRDISTQDSTYAGLISGERTTLQRGDERDDRLHTVFEPQVRMAA